MTLKNINGWWLEKAYPDDESDRRYDIMLNDDREHVCDCVYEKEDAILFLAAPELLIALKRLIHNGQKQGWNDNYESDMIMARSAVGKAEEIKSNA